MTSQQQATLALLDWQEQRKAGIPPEQRRLPINDNKSADEFARDLAVIRECLERKS